MRKRFPFLLLALCMALSDCAPQAAVQEQKQYTATFLTLFDTVTTIMGRSESEEAFQATAQAVHDDLLIYHQLFDIYNDYDGIANLKTINDQAGIAPVQVDPAILALLADCKAYYAATDGVVNAAMGSVLRLWHEARSAGIDDPASARLPDATALQAAAQHCSFDAVEIDTEKGTVFITDPDVQLDVGAIAKGWSVQRAAEKVPEGLLISVGGNVCATGPKGENTPWVIGIQDPDSDQYLHTVYLNRGSVVTSGDYQRAYLVDGKLYHHIIVPDTLYPADSWRSVTIVCEDSGLADALSTALFILPLQEGLDLLEGYDARAMWVNAQGEIFYSPGFEDLIRT